MPEEMNELPEELREVERRLAGLSPATAGNRDAMLFAVGRAAGRRASHVRLWQGLCGALTLGVALLAMASVMLRPEPAAERPAANDGLLPPTQEARLPTPSDEPPVPVVGTPLSQRAQEQADDAMSYLALRNVVLANGITALPIKSDFGNARSANGAALRPDEGLKDLPVWQRRAAINGGNGI